MSPPSFSPDNKTLAALHNKTLAAADDTLAARLADARARYVTGRHDELAYWHDFIHPHHERPIWFVIGPGGIGKTTLLRLFQDQAQAQGYPIEYLDASHIPPSPPTVQSALVRAISACSETGNSTQTPLLLIDAFEYWSELEDWLRQTFLPAQSSAMRIIISGRLTPGQDWLADAGWRPLVHISNLSALSEDECRLYLSRRGVTKAHQQRLATFSAGHPLALAIATDALLAGHRVPDSITENDTGLIRPLVNSFTREAMDDTQRQALNAAAVVRDLNASLLGEMLGTDNASALFTWLEQLSFTSVHDTGLSLHDLVRDSLMCDMPTRFPGQYETLASHAMSWIVNRIEQSQSLTWDAAATLAADAMYALRAAPLVRYFITPDEESGRRALYLDHWRPGDEAVIHSMIARHEGTDSLYWFRFWHQRAPKGVVVLRNAAQEAVAFLLRLDMETLDAADRNADPLTHKLWQALTTEFGLRPGDHVPFIRHWVTHDYAVSNSPEKTRLLMAIHTYNLTAKNLRLSAQVFDETGQWEAPAAALGIHLLRNSDTLIAGKNWRIYYNDWAIEPPISYYRHFADRALGQIPDTTEPTATPPSTSVETLADNRTCALDETTFASAVRLALRQFHHADKLADNPLLLARLVLARIKQPPDPTARTSGLRACLETAITELAENGPTGKRQAMILRATFLEPGQTRKTAAATLHMSYSSLRRHLDRALQDLIADLWHRETALRQSC